MSFAFEDLPAVFLLVQYGSDEDQKFRTRSDFLSAASSLGTRCYFAVMDGDRNQKTFKNTKDSKSFYFFRYGKLVGRYTGSATTEGIVDFAMSRTGIPFVTFDDYSIAQDFIESNSGSVVLFLEKPEGPLFDKYYKFADVNRDNYSFGLCPDADIAYELGIETIPTLFLYRTSDHTKTEYIDDLDSATIEDLNRWLLYSMEPKYVTFEVQNQRQYYGKQILLFFTPVEEEQRDESLKVVLQLSEQYNSRFLIAVIDAVTGNRFMTGLGFSRYADPSVSILVYNKNGQMKKYLYNEEDPFTVEDIGNFIELYKSHKLKPFIRSAKINDDDNVGTVKEVNAETFKENVINNKINVIVLYFEDWDRIYQQFLPQFEEVAEIFKKENKNDIKFVKFNVAANDRVEGPDPNNTPAIYMFAEGLKKKPIHYKGKLQKENLVKFICDELEINIEL
ncbi:Protein disulfide-isomerase [Histomonas meleagridis]|uniref:Protein disulfide-isomerase n=1 Tax=Histomonas meleagridis TaxID=135588 RepID=UPI00355A6D46|nr:Protein disulfide-isomerase [Histomonas meleagridis]KAH0802658.1 Protein disulfide-isomerase [Histomonas meleagridis]